MNQGADLLSRGNTLLPKRSEHASGNRCGGARMAPHSPLCVHIDCVNIPNPLQDEGGRTEDDIESSYWLAEIIHILYKEPWSLPQRPAVTGTKGDIYPHPQCLALWAWPVSGLI